MPVNSIQNLWADLRKKKHNLAEIKFERKEKLMKKPDYASAAEKISEAREVQKKIVLQYDSENEDREKNKIADLTEEINDLTETIGIRTLNEYIKNKPVSLTDGVWKYGPTFKVEFKKQGKLDFAAVKKLAQGNQD